MKGAIVLASLITIRAVPIAAPVHEEAVLESPQSSVAAGDTLALQGSDFAEEEGYKLRLVGALREYELREVKADAEGKFSLDLAMPRSVTAGQYQLVAVASDGDVVARLDITVLASRPADVEATRSEPAASEDTEHGGGAALARSDDIRIERDRSGLEWGVIGLLIGGAAGLGAGMLRSRSRESVGDAATD
ncbi:MAG: hypothetical protein ACE5JR_06480 [Gemmatimonadota bacterium]